MKNRKIKFCLTVGLLAILSGCSSMDLLKNIQRPQVEFVNAKLSGLSFEAVDLLFNLKVKNPNPVGITLAGYDYNFSINKNSFLQGNQETAVKIPSSGENTFQIPLSLRFVDIYKAVASLVNKDDTDYKMDVGIAFDVPVLGRQRIPLSKLGIFPLIKIPKISVSSLKLDRLNLTGADLTLKVKLDNPNAFSFILKNINYKFDVNNNEWLNGSRLKNLEIGAKKDGLLEIPISLNFLQIGQTVYQMLTNNQPLDYNFKGNIDLASSLELLKEANLPFDKAGQIKLTR